MRTIERAEREVQEAIERVRRCAEEKGTPTLAAVERELWTILLALGRAVIALYLARRAARPRAATYVHEGARFVFDPDTRRRTETGTRFGKVPLVRAVGRPLDGRRRTDFRLIANSVWEAGGCLHQEGSAALRQWAQSELSKLRQGKIAEVLDDLATAHNAIPKTGPGNKGRRKRLLAIIEYLAKHEHRMPYAALRRDDLDIGTGAVEGAVRNLVGLRLDGPGMRWGRDCAEMILHLRCIFLNGQWDDFCRHLEARPIRLAPQPVTARTHDTESQQSRKAA